MSAPHAHTFEDYRAIPAVNWSNLKHADRSPLHYLYARDHGVTETDPMRLGGAVHTLALEPDLFESRYTVWTEARTSNAWKAYKAANADRIILTADQDARAHGIAAAIRAHPVAAHYLDGGLFEQTLTWVDEVTGLPCKARADILSKRCNAVIDLKTYADLSPRAFESATFKLGYPCQLSHYRNGAIANGILSADCETVIIGVESKAPFDVGVFVLDSESMAHGAAKVAELLAKVRACTDANEWPGRYPTTQAYMLPEWARQAPDITFEEEES